MFFAPYKRLAKTIKDGNWLRGKFADMNNENIVSALFNCRCKFVNLHAVSSDYSRFSNFAILMHSDCKNYAMSLSETFNYNYT